MRQDFIRLRGGGIHCSTRFMYPPSAIIFRAPTFFWHAFSCTRIRGFNFNVVSLTDTIFIYIAFAKLQKEIIIMVSVL